MSQPHNQSLYHWLVGLVQSVQPVMMGDLVAHEWTIQIDDIKEVGGPEVPPPIWDERPIDGAACMAATRALCAGVK